MMLKKGDVKIISKEEAFWIERKTAAENVLNQMKQDTDRMPHLIKFQEAIIKMCDEHIKHSK